MANPRDVVVLDGQNEGPLTLLADNVTITYDATKPGGSTAVGKAAKLSGNSTVALAADGDAIIGRVESVEASGVSSTTKVTVRCDGVVRLPGGNAATLTLGSKVVGAADAGGNPGFIRTMNSAVAAETTKSRGVILDASTASDVAIWL